MFFRQLTNCYRCKTPLTFLCTARHTICFPCALTFVATTRDWKGACPICKELIFETGCTPSFPFTTVGSQIIWLTSLCPAFYVLYEYFQRKIDRIEFRKCPFCDKTFKNLACVMAHLVQNKCLESGYECRKCRREVKTLFGYEVHLKYECIRSFAVPTHASAILNTAIENLKHGINTETTEMVIYSIMLPFMRTADCTRIFNSNDFFNL